MAFLWNVDCVLFFLIPLNMFNVFRTVKERNKAMDRYTFEIRDQLNSGVALSAIEALRRKRTRQKRANDRVNEVAFQGTLYHQRLSYLRKFFIPFKVSSIISFLSDRELNNCAEKIQASLLFWHCMKPHFQQQTFPT